MASRPPAVWALLLVSVLGCVRKGWTFSNGSVAYSCGTLLPGHMPNSASSLASPYTVTASASTYRPGGSITVTMETASTSSIPFQGFILQARSRVGQEGWPVGCFTNINSSLINTLDCSGMQNSSISHSSKTEKRKVQATWEAPSNGSYGDIYFCASFVQTYSIFWVKVTSGDVKLDSSAGRTPAGSLNLLLLTGLALAWGRTSA